MSYPSTDYDAKVARCYVCDDVFSTQKMKMIGPDKENPGKWIFRCTGCYAGSPKWMKHFFDRSSLRKLFMDAEGNQLGPDTLRGIGRRVVEETKERNEHEICVRLDSKKSVRDVDGPAGEACPARGRRRGKVPKKDDGNGNRKRRGGVPRKTEPTSGVPLTPKVEGGAEVGGKRKSWRTATIRRRRR